MLVALLSTLTLAHAGPARMHAPVVEMSVPAAAPACEGALVVTASAALWRSVRLAEITGEVDASVDRASSMRLRRDIDGYRRAHGPLTGPPPAWLLDAFTAYLNGTGPDDPSTRQAVVRMSAPADLTPERRSDDDRAPITFETVPAWLWAKYRAFTVDPRFVPLPDEARYLRRLHRAVVRFANANPASDLHLTPAPVRRAYRAFIDHAILTPDPKLRREVLRIYVASDYDRPYQW